MKRYNMAINHIGGAIFATRIKASEDPDGEWVRYEDVQRLLDVGGHSDSGEFTELESVECNCAEEAPDRKTMKDWPLADLSWMCPAHGYKAL